MELNTILENKMSSLDPDWTSVFQWILSKRNVLQSLPIIVRIPIKLFLWTLATWISCILALIQSLRLFKRVLLGGSVAHTASFTSAMVTQCRFIGSLHKICDDNLAIEFLLFISKLYVLVRILVAIATDKQHFIRPLDLNVSGRCMRGDQALLNLAPDITQVVILGAGNDTRLHRLVGLPDNLFEVDAPLTQAYKLERLGKHRNPLVRFVSANFEHESWLANLIIAGFDPSKKALFIWEGVTYYLTETAVRATLHSISQCAPGSKLVLDYAVLEKQFFGAHFGLWLFGKLGEPFRSLFTDESLPALVAEYRLRPDGPVISAREATRERFASNEAYEAMVTEYQSQPATAINIKLISFTLTA